MTPAEVNEQKAGEAFSRQSVVFDDIYSNNPIINYKRERVRSHVLQFLSPNSSILELNSGTGEDAIFFAGSGHKVHASDISKEMQEVLINKVNKNGVGDLITTELCSFTRLDQLKNKGPYDLIFSNFAGLNCTGRLDLVLNSFDELLKPGGYITLVIMPRFCLWETMLLFKGHFKTAFRRFFSRHGKRAHVEGVFFKCWYYDPSYLIRRMKKKYSLESLEGLCTLVPPSYIENFPSNHPRLFHFLEAKENKYRTKWPWRSIGDYYIISFRKNIRH